MRPTTDDYTLHHHTISNSPTHDILLEPQSPRRHSCNPIHQHCSQDTPNFPTIFVDMARKPGVLFVGENESGRGIHIQRAAKLASLAPYVVNFLRILYTVSAAQTSEHGPNLRKKCDVSHITILPIVHNRYRIIIYGRSMTNQSMFTTTIRFP